MSTEGAAPASSEGDLTPKVLLHLRSVGEAPALKRNKFKLSGEKQLIEVEKFLKKSLGQDRSVYLYCGSGFSPTSDQLLQDLYDNFQVGGELTINYGVQEAWG
jgi:ubiquitin-like protein ATG12